MLIEEEVDRRGGRVPSLTISGQRFSEINLTAI